MSSSSSSKKKSKTKGNVPSRDVNYLVENFGVLDDSIFERVVSRCLDLDRGQNVLQAVIRGWNKIQKKMKKRILAGTKVDKPRTPRLVSSSTSSSSGAEFLAAATKEEEIVRGMKRLSDDDYKDVCILVFDFSRTVDILKRSTKEWLSYAGEQPSEAGGRDSDDDDEFDDSVIEIPYIRPPVELIDLMSPSRKSPPSPEPSSAEVASRKTSKKSKSKRRNKSNSRSRSRSPSTSKSNKTSETRSSRKRHRDKNQSPSRSPSLTNGHFNLTASAESYQNQLFDERAALTMGGVWTAEMEADWVGMENAEANLAMEFETRGNTLADYPEQHPKYAKEWKEFWEHKAAVLEDAGLDAETYDYIPEWKEYWARRMETLLRLEFNTKLDEIRKKFGMDLNTLQSYRKNIGQSKPSSSSSSINRQGTTSTSEHSNSNGTTSNSKNSFVYWDVGDYETSPKAADEFQIRPPQHHDKSTWRTASSVVTSTTTTAPTTNESRVQGIPRPRSSPTSSCSSSKSSSKTKESSLGRVDIFQVLRRLTALEGQLGSMAPQVLDFFKIAERMEVSGSGNCNALLTNEEFIELIYRCRHRFHGLSGDNVLPSDILGALKHSIQSMTVVLDYPKSKNILSKIIPHTTWDTGRCSRSRSPSPEFARRINTTIAPIAPIPHSIPMPPPILPVGQAPHPHDLNNESGRDKLTLAIGKRTAHLSEDKKERLAELMTIALLRAEEAETEEGEEDDELELSEKELLEFITASLDPYVVAVERHKSPPRAPSKSVSKNRQQSRSREEQEFNGKGKNSPERPRQLSPDHWKRNQMNPDATALPTVVQPWTGDYETGTKRAIGLAIPPIPSVRAKAASPPPNSAEAQRSYGSVAIHVQEVRRGMFDDDDKSRSSSDHFAAAKPISYTTDPEGYSTELNFKRRRFGFKSQGMKS